MTLNKSKYFLVIIFFLFNTKICINDNPDYYYYFCKMLSNIAISGNDKIKDTIDSLTILYKKLAEDEIEDSGVSIHRKNLHHIEKLKNHYLSKLTWHELAIYIQHCANSDKTKKFLESNTIIQKELNKEYSIITQYALKKNYKTVDQMFFSYLRLIRLARDYEKINIDKESFLDFQNYLKKVN